MVAEHEITSAAGNIGVGAGVVGSVPPPASL